MFKAKAKKEEPKAIYLTRDITVPGWKKNETNNGMVELIESLNRYQATITEMYWDIDDTEDYAIKLIMTIECPAINWGYLENELRDEWPWVYKAGNEHRGRKLKIS